MERKNPPKKSKKKLNQRVFIFRLFNIDINSVTTLNEQMQNVTLGKEKLWSAMMSRKSFVYEKETK